MKQFNELKLGKSLKWVIYKISDDKKSILVDETSSEDNYEAFREKLIAAGPRYAVYDIAYEVPGAGKRYANNLQYNLARTR